MTLASTDLTLVYSRDEYRRWCEGQVRGRYERVDGRIVAMPAQSGAHVRTKGAVYSALHRAVKLSGRALEALPDGATVETGDCDYEPDALVYSGPPMDGYAVAVPNPVIVVEVLLSMAVDTGLKLVGFFEVPSIAHY